MQTPIAKEPGLSDRLRSESWTAQLTTNSGVLTCGLCTSVLAAAIVNLVMLFTQLPLHTVFIKHVVPAGAIGCGFAGAIGCWAGARLLQRPPSRLLLADCVLCGWLTYFAVYVGFYWTMEVDDTPIRELMSFASYAQQILGLLSQGDDESGITVVDWIDEALILSGFAIGGYFVYRLAARTAYCQECGRYFSKQGRQHHITYWSDLSAMRQQVADLSALLADGKVSAAVVQHAREAPVAPSEGSGQLLLEGWKCVRCGAKYLRLISSEGGVKGWKETGRVVGQAPGIADGAEPVAML